MSRAAAPARYYLTAATSYQLIIHQLFRDNYKCLTLKASFKGDKRSKNDDSAGILQTETIFSPWQLKHMDTAVRRTVTSRPLRLRHRILITWKQLSLLISCKRLQCPRSSRMQRPANSPALTSQTTNPSHNKSEPKVTKRSKDVDSAAIPPNRNDFQLVAAETLGFRQSRLVH